jgi:hypothetical protein
MRLAVLATRSLGLVGQFTSAMRLDDTRSKEIQALAGRKSCSLGREHYTRRVRRLLSPNIVSRGTRLNDEAQSGLTLFCELGVTAEKGRA